MSAAADSTQVDSLVAQALATSPTIRAARARAEAMRREVGPAGALPDPMLMMGIQNYPIAEHGFADFMAMKMLGISQTIPYPGKRSLRSRAAEHEHAAAMAVVDDARLEVVAAVRGAYYDLAYIDRALELADRNQRLLVDFTRVAEARYGVGTGRQEEVLRMRVEAARVGEDAVMLAEQRRATVARLNGLLDRPSETPVSEPRIPHRIARAAVADSAAQVRFVSATLGARSADSPLPPLEALQATAVRRNAMLRSADAMIAAQAARAELARKEHLPDFDVALSYGQRDGFSDMVTALVSAPIPFQKGRKQDALVARSRAEFAALEAERHAQANTLRADVARLYADIERDRAQLALYVKAILPQGRAALASATTGYPLGQTDFLSVLDTQTTLFTYEATYFRVLSEFASALAELERIVGEEIVR